MEANKRLGQVISVELSVRGKTLIQFKTEEKVHRTGISMDSMFFISVPEKNTEYYFKPVSILYNQSTGGQYLITAEQVGYYNKISDISIRFIVDNYTEVYLTTHQETINKINRESTYC